MGCSTTPKHRPRRRHCSMAGRQRHQSPRPTTNRRNSARNAPGPVETTPRPRYRACHRPARRCEFRQATRRTHRTQSKRRQAAPVPTTRTASQQAVRTWPIAHPSRRIAALRTRDCTPRGGRTGSTLPGIRLFLQIKGRAPPGQPAYVLASLPAAPPSGLARQR
jgi:hypothetical protein